jgi:hypothetical protein
VRGFLALLALLLGLGFAGAAASHEVRPAYLEIDQTAPSDYRITWKQPVVGDMAIHLAPHLSGGWLDQPPTAQYASEGFLIRTWNVHEAGGRGLAGQTVSIEGLKDTITDVFVRVRPARGAAIETIVRPEAPSFRIAQQGGSPGGVLAFLRLGVEHILTGPDHLLFVLGLILIVRDRGTLLKTVSAFTVAHSLTLAAATLGLISLPVPLLNALIALSILFVAPEALRARAGGTSFTIRFPWVAAFGFGLLHGMGFASGLTSLGLSGTSLAPALLLFNVGVEIGQVAFIGLVFALIRALRLMQVRWPRPVTFAPAYAIGVAGASWTFQYAAIVFGLAR